MQVFLDTLASSAPVPGGGGASALCGAIGIALGSMVSNLTIGKKKYLGVQEQIQSILCRTETLRYELGELIDEDAKAFYPLSQAYSLPANTPEQAAFREQELESTLEKASIVPLRIMEKSLSCIELLSELMPIGSRIAISDVGVGVQLCRAALNGAAMNVYINTKLIKNRSLADELNKRANELITTGTAKADEVYSMILDSLT